MNYSDRDLLVMAAKACGRLSSAWEESPDYIDGMIQSWNPLKDDADALKLAVKMRLCVDNMIGEESSRIDVSVSDESSVFADEWRGDDPCAATRRAIVRAAAASS